MKFQKLIRRVWRRFQEKPWESLLFLVIVGLAAIPIVVMIDLVVRYSVNTPFWDQWEYVFLVHKMHVGSLNIHDLWMQHNEHRILFPRVVTLVLSLLTNYNVRYEVFVSFITASLTYTFLLLMIRKTFGKLTKSTAVLILLLTWLFFSPLQWINWIWGFQLCFFMGVLFSVVTIWLVTKVESKAFSKLFYIALVSGTIATYCVGNGLVIWAVGFILLLLQKADRKKVFTWIGVSIAVAATYLYKFHRAPGSLPLGTIAREPVAVIKYFLTYLGRNLSWTPIGSRYTGFTLLTLLVVCLIVIYRKGQLRKVLPWIGLALYVVASALIAAVSRLNFGVNQAFADSYTTMSVLFVIATIAVVFYAADLLLKKNTKSRYQAALVVALLLGALCVPLVSSFVYNYSYGVQQLEAQSRDLLKVQRCVYSARSVNDPCLLYASPDKQVAWQGIQILRQLKWGNFGDH